MYIRKLLIFLSKKHKIKNVTLIFYENNSASENRFMKNKYTPRKIAEYKIEENKL